MPPDIQNPDVGDLLGSPRPGTGYQAPPVHPATGPPPVAPWTVPPPRGPAGPAPPDPGAAGTAGRGRRPRSARWLLEWVAVLVVALLLAVGVRAFVAQMFYIPSGSMLPTLQVGDRIVVNKLSYRLHGVGRGDVVVFRRPPLEQANYADLVKRVVALPGETVSLAGGRVYVDGQPLTEPWLPDPAPVTSPSPLPEAFSLNHPFTVPPGEYFVMGDNRTDSEDSRYFGPIQGSLIVGKMAFVAWPFTYSTWIGVLSVAAVVVLVLLILVIREPGPARTRPVSEGTW